MKTKDKIIAFAVLIAAVINTYECAKKIKRDIDNWAETTTIAKNINVENINDDNQINIPTRRIDCELISMKEMRERLGIPEEVKVQEIESETNKEEITQEVKEKEPLIIRYGYVKNDTNYNHIDGTYYADIEAYQKVAIDWETDTFYGGMLENNVYAFFNKEDIELIPDTFVEVDISSQTVNLYKNNELIMTTSVTTGFENKYDTRLGYFYIYYKQADTYLIGPGYKLHVDYWVPFDGGIGFHDAYWRYDFGGDIYKTNGSHGCINMQNDAAKTLYENVEANTRVLVHK